MRAAVVPLYLSEGESSMRGWFDYLCHPTLLFDDDLLQSFTDTFYGYGNYQGRYWFVGMEEGGGGSFEEIARKLSAWDTRGQKELESFGESSSESAQSKHFTDQPKSQATWNKLIRILLSIEGEIPSLDAVKTYQATRWGRSDSDNCLLELLPLPSPSTGKWLYGNHSALPHLGTREAYGNHYAEQRSLHIKSRIEEYEPDVVVFYGFDEWYRQWWKLIAGVEFTLANVGGHKAYLGSNGHTVFAIVKHPVTRGISKEYFHQIGRIIAESFA